MSRTDKTDPHRVKVKRYGERYYEPIHHCGCWLCRGSWRDQAKREDKTASKRALRFWDKDYR